jgi:hypothetical protein
MTTRPVRVSTAMIDHVASAGAGEVAISSTARDKKIGILLEVRRMSRLLIDRGDVDVAAIWARATLASRQPVPP